MAFSPFSHPAQLEGSSFAPDVVAFDDFFNCTYVAGGQLSATDNQGQWFVTATNEGSIVPSIGEVGGVLHITTDTAGNDGYNAEWGGTPFQVQEGRDILFSAKLKLTAAAAPTTTIDWAIGLGNDGITKLTAATGMTDFIGFHGGTTILCDNQADPSIIATTGGAASFNDWTSTTLQNAKDTGEDFVDDTWFTVGFRVIGNSRVKFFLNGEFVHESATLLPSDSRLSPKFAIYNNAAAAKQMLIDYVYCQQSRNPIEGNA